MSESGFRRFSIQTWLWGWAVVFAILLHGVSCFSAESFWLDEADSVTVAGRAWHSMWDSLAYDTFPLGHVVLFKLWLGLFSFWPPETALRLLGFLIGCSVALTFAAFCRHFAPNAPPLFFLFFNFNPAVVRYIDSARPYGLSTLFFLLLAYNALEALESGKSRSFWLAILAALGAVHSHYFNALGVLAIGAAVLLTGWGLDEQTRQRSWKIGGGIVLALASSLIYVPLLQRAVLWLPWTRQPEHDVSGLFFALNWLLNGMSSATAYLWIFPVSFSFVLLFGSTDSTLAKGRRAFCLLCSVGASVLLLVFMLLGRTNASPWYFIPTLGLTAMCLEPAWVRLIQLSPLVRPILRLGGASLCLFFMADAWASLRQPMATIDHAAQLVERRTTERDVVLVTPWPSGVTFGFYYRGLAPFTTVPPLTDYSMVRFDLAGQAVTETQPLAGVWEALERSLRNGGKVFVVGQLEKRLPHGLIKPDEQNADQLKWVRLQWEAQVTTYLSRHTRLRKELLPEAVCFSSECPSVTMYSGWK